MYLFILGGVVHSLSNVDVSTGFICHKRLNLEMHIYIDNEHRYEYCSGVG